MTIEDAVHEVLATAIGTAAEGDPLYKAELHDTVYQTITQDYGVRVGDCESDLAPLAGGEEMGEFDAMLTIVCFARVEGADKTERKAARAKARSLMLAIAKILFNDPTLNGQVRDARVLRAKRGFDSITDADDYAVANLPLIVNETGQQIDFERRLYA